MFELCDASVASWFYLAWLRQQQERINMAIEVSGGTKV
jgi:hypothetical protein